jgi:DNA-binding HxlR family transcriptional regulator
MSGETRLTHNTALILQAIDSGFVYGFSIMEMTGLPSGTVYPAMRRMEEDQLIRSRWERQAIADREQRPPRKYYQLTNNGKLLWRLRENGIHWLGDWSQPRGQNHDTFAFAKGRAAHASRLVMGCILAGTCIDTCGMVEGVADGIVVRSAGMLLANEATTPDPFDKPPHSALERTEIHFVSEDDHGTSNGFSEESLVRVLCAFFY